MNLVDLFGDGSISISDLLINLVLGTALSIVLALYYIRFGRTYSDRTNHARILPFLAVTTLLVITVVKSSLALSLGLVGALSIVRFRTPIKEPEELAYLFLAIAIGLGLGANQRAATLIAVPVILVLLVIPNMWAKRTARQNTFMLLEIPNVDEAKTTFDKIIASLDEHAISADLRRMDMRGSNFEATLFVAAQSAGDIASLIDIVRADYPEVGVTFVEQETGFDV
jgi:hypothetical protein